MPGQLVIAAVVYSKKPISNYLPWWWIYKCWKLDNPLGTLNNWESGIFQGVRDDLRIKENLYIPVGKFEPKENPLLVIPVYKGYFVLSRKTGLYHYNSDILNYGKISVLRREFCLFENLELFSEYRPMGLIRKSSRNYKEGYIDEFNINFVRELVKMGVFPYK